MRVWLSYGATPLERFYFPTYARFTLFADLPALPNPGLELRLLKSFPVVFRGDYLATSDVLPQSPGRVIVRDVRSGRKVLRAGFASISMVAEHWQGCSVGRSAASEFVPRCWL